MCSNKIYKNVNKSYLFNKKGLICLLKISVETDIYDVTCNFESNRQFCTQSDRNNVLKLFGHYL